MVIDLTVRSDFPISAAISFWVADGVFFQYAKHSYLFQSAIFALWRQLIAHFCTLGESIIIDLVPFNLFVYQIFFIVFTVFPILYFFTIHFF